MSRRLRKAPLVVSACAALVLSGCGGHIDAGPLSAMVDRPAPLPAIVSQPRPHPAYEVPNPLRGQYEDLLQPLFPQGNPAQSRYPAWPEAHDAGLRIPWRALQPTDPRTLPADAPDDRKFDFSVIDTALAELGKRNMRLMLRVYAYNSYGDAFYPNRSNIAVPDWVAALPGAVTRYPGPPNSPEAWLTQVVPNWNDPGYLDAFSQLLAALGRRYDRDERLSVFEFSGYGDFSENHIAYLRDALGAPGPAPEDSVAKLGYYSHWRDQNITTDSIRRLVAANVNAFPHTQLVVNPPNPEIVRQLFADDVTKKLSYPVGIRSDHLGVRSVLPTWARITQSYYVQTDDPLVDVVKRRLASAPVITEWGELPTGVDPHSYYESALQDVIDCHVSMTSSLNFPDRESTVPMDPGLYALWAKANASAGYRYSVEAQPGSQSIRGNVATVSVVWTNYGSAAAFEHWAPVYKLVDSSGLVVRTLPAKVNLRTLVHDGSGKSPQEAVPASAAESVPVDLTGLAPGQYTLRASVDWQQHKPAASHVVNYPPMALARDGRDDAGSYPIATLDTERKVLSAATPQPAADGG
ncbi:hypothetical protein KXD96_04885 [Mycobacterium sp. SMC-2]|uniref:hypothetical protein n=1 Tax=Mycobacterium sp. SMC-2 TaxID=2857058 RepID=UPI0021B30ABC|nr:hypothetical protein [Mycobacterium sp. SMC-2]UXA09188.1 hypothetical protein KXD96_04885 [Mycobacterium sp. SMC-2]